MLFILLPISFSPHPRGREAFLRRTRRARACGPIAFIKAQCHRTRYLRPPCTRTYSLEVSAASIENRSRRVSPPSSCILTRQNEAIEPVASRRILLRLPPNFVLPLVAFAYNSHYISFFSLSLSLADCATKFEFSTKFEQFHWEKGAATERESTIGERN